MWEFDLWSVLMSIHKYVSLINVKKINIKLPTTSTEVKAVGGFFQSDHLGTVAASDGGCQGVSQVLPPATTLSTVCGGSDGVSRGFSTFDRRLETASTASCNVSVLR